MFETYRRLTGTVTALAMVLTSIPVVPAQAQTTVTVNGRQARTSNSIASSHVLALNYDHWHYSFVARYFHNGGQWQDGVDIGTPQGPIKSTGWGYYAVVGYNF